MSLIPAERIGLNTQLRYQGYGSAAFGTPVVRVSGPTVVNTDERGNTVAEMQVEEVPTACSIDERMAQLSRDFFNNINERTPCTLRVECPDGVFTATEQAFRDPSIDFPNRRASIKFHCFRSQFERPDASTVYWRLPIWNFHGRLRPGMAIPEILHPLRLSGGNPVSSFEFLGEPGLVEFIPGYKELLEQQKNGDRNPTVTATTVGATAGRPTTWEGLDSWFPFEYLTLLGFASGSRVGSPWIEFLDAHGHLAKRVHVHLGTNRYETGVAFVDDIVNRGGLGRLLTRAERSAEFGKTYLPSR